MRIVFVPIVVAALCGCATAPRSTVQEVQAVASPSPVALITSREMPPPAVQGTRESNGMVEAQKRVEQMKVLQRQLMAQIKSRESAAAAQHKAESAPAPQLAGGSDMATSATAMARLQGQLDRQVADYDSKRPRKKFIGARATEYRFAQYQEAWRQKVERIGNLNYPEDAKGKVYGTLVLTVEIKADGTISSITIDRSSGRKVLDDAAVRIVQMAAPFQAFPPSLSDVDILGIIGTWSFEKAGPSAGADQLKAGERHD